MSTLLLYLLILYELISAFLIYKLWSRKRRPQVLKRCFLSLFLVVPVLGWLFYGFLNTSPESDGETVSGYPASGWGWR
jgi:hypothetical protein